MRTHHFKRTISEVSKRDTEGLTLVRSEAPQVRLTHHVLPVHQDVYANYSGISMQNDSKDNRSGPFTSGGKFGLLKALRSYDDIFDTLFPLNRVWLKYKQHSAADTSVPEENRETTLRATYPV